MNRVVGWGCAAVLAIIMVISFVGWSLTFLDGSAPIRQLRPVPADVPPAGGEAVPAIDVHAAGRTSQKLAFWAEPLAADTGISVAALEAYGNAELIAAESWPECHLRWNTLAGIGFVETRHGTYSGNLFGGSHLDENGVAVPSIIGVPLDGSPGFAEVPDTDGGALDNDSQFDRAVGPMQFIPESWNRYGRDADGDGNSKSAAYRRRNRRPPAPPRARPRIRGRTYSRPPLLYLQAAIHADRFLPPPVVPHLRAR